MPDALLLSTLGHGFPFANYSLLGELAEFQPSVVTLESDIRGAEFIWPFALENPKRQRRISLDLALSGVALEYTAGIMYATGLGIPLYPIDVPEHQEIERFSFTAGSRVRNLVHRLAQRLPGHLESYRKKREEDISAEGMNRRDAIMARHINAFIDAGERVAHIGGSEHISRDEGGRSDRAEGCLNKLLSGTYVSVSYMFGDDCIDRPIRKYLYSSMDGLLITPFQE